MFRLLQGVFASMSLERKCLLFFGSALSILMCCAFFVVQKLGKELVKDTTRQRAQDYGAAELAIIHGDAGWASSAGTEAEIQKTRDRVDAQRGLFLKADIDFTVLGLEDAVRYDRLPPPNQPEDDAERQLLQGLESKYRLQLAQRIAEDRPDVASTLDLGENESMSRIGLGASAPVFTELGPVDDRYIYYKPVFPNTQCIICHQALDASMSLSPDLASSTEDPLALAQRYPFRVIRVSMPYQDTQETTTWIRAIIIALALSLIHI